MYIGNYLNFSILDIIRFNRTKSRLVTENKSCYVVSCRISGESVFFYNGESHVIKKGDVLYIPKGASYLQECEREEIVCFHLNAYGNALDYIKVYTPENPEDVCNLFRHAASIWTEKKDNYIYNCMSDLYKIVALTGAGVYNPDSLVPDIISPSMDYINACMYDENLSLEKACRQAHISRTYFNKIFRDFYNCTPLTYINKARIDKAKMLLESGCYTREEIAALCGFSDVKYFYVVFKKITRLTTAQYLKRLKI